MIKPNRGAVAVVGTGKVGSTFAYTLMLRGLVSEIILYDLDQSLAQGHALDLNHGVPLSTPVRITAGTLRDCAQADVVVMAGGVAQRPGESRLQLVDGNVEVVREVVGELMDADFSGILLMATNPVDVLAYAAWRLSGFASRRVIGSGTVLDSARLRYLLGEHYQVDPRNVHAYVLGEHGDSELPAWSLTHVAGLPPVGLWGQNGNQTWREDIFQQVRDAAQHIIAKKGATYFAIALGLARITESILHDHNSVLTVSTLVEDYYGIDGVYLGLPCVINRTGVARVLRPQLSETEIELLKASAHAVRRTIKAARLTTAPELT